MAKDIEFEWPSHREFALIVWLRMTIMFCGCAFIGLVGYAIFLFKPIADISMLHCVNVIREEARLTEWQGVLDLERQKMDEEQLKKSK